LDNASTSELLVQENIISVYAFITISVSTTDCLINAITFLELTQDNKTLYGKIKIINNSITVATNDSASENSLFIFYADRTSTDTQKVKLTISQNFLCFYNVYDHEFCCVFNISSSGNFNPFIEGASTNNSLTSNTEIEKFDGGSTTETTLNN
jgi:hypothetical protein